jgi:hypothetical protein
MPDHRGADPRMPTRRDLVEQGGAGHAGPEQISQKWPPVLRQKPATTQQPKQAKAIQRAELAALADRTAHVAAVAAIA